MFLFSEAISKKAPVEIPLKGRIFTWSNVQDAPSLEKLDWSFSSEAWTLTYPSTFPMEGLYSKIISNKPSSVIEYIGRKPFFVLYILNLFKTLSMYVLWLSASSHLDLSL